MPRMVCRVLLGVFLAGMSAGPVWAYWPYAYWPPYPVAPPGYDVPYEYPAPDYYPPRASVPYRAPVRARPRIRPDAARLVRPAPRGIVLPFEGPGMLGEVSSAGGGLVAPVLPALPGLRPGLPRAATAVPAPVLPPSAPVSPGRNVYPPERLLGD